MKIFFRLVLFDENTTVMKTKLVLWGKNADDQRVLAAIELKPEANSVGTYLFPESVATDDFANEMMQSWRDGKEVTMPEEHSYSETPLSVTERIIPEGLDLERVDLLTRAQTEWHFVVLSSKLHDVYRGELNDLKEKISQLSKYDSSMWNELKTFWNKVREQITDQNLFREHADQLQNNTNELFGKLKELRAKMEAGFQERSTEMSTQFSEQLEQIEGRINEGSHLSSVFEDLKKIQRKFKDTKFTRDDRNKIWQRIDGAFKTVKEKRFGPDANNDTSASGRLNRRMDGLMKAMERMQKSIARDRDDLGYQEHKIARTDGQLEAQIRKAKMKMIEERISSKQERLEDMKKTQEQIEKQIAKQADRDAKREEREKIEAAKKEAKAKIDEQAAMAASAMQDKAEDLAKAASAITGKKDTPDSEDESLFSAVSEAVSETVENVSDTVRAVASVVGMKAKAAFDDIKQGGQHLAEEARERGSVAVENLKEKAAETKEMAEEQIVLANEKAAELKAQADVRMAEIQAAADEKIAAVQAQVNEKVEVAKAAAEEQIILANEKAAELKAQADEKIAAAKVVAEEQIVLANEKTAELKAQVDEKMAATKAQVSETVDQAKTAAEAKIASAQETVYSSTENAEPTATADSKIAEALVAEAKKGEAESEVALPTDETPTGATEIALSEEGMATPPEPVIEVDKDALANAESNDEDKKHNA